MNRNDSVCYGDDIVIGSGDRGFIKKLQDWGDELIQKMKF